MKIINVSNRPYEFTFDGGNYPAIQPGEVVDYPDPIARHAIKRSVIMDEEGLGEAVGFRVQELGTSGGSMSDRDLKTTCPLAAVGKCDSGLMSVEDLKAHMDGHWAPSRVQQPLPVNAPGAVGARKG